MVRLEIYLDILDDIIKENLHSSMVRLEIGVKEYSDDIPYEFTFQYG